MSDATPIDNLFRGLVDGVELRADGNEAAMDGTTMHGHFTVFDEWTEIDSWFEGRFLERLVKGSFRKTFRENRDQVKVQFDHGYDVHVGSAPLGPIDLLREEDQGAYYEVPLLDTDYNRNRIQPLLQGRLINGQQRGSLLGASFRFRVVKDEWNRAPKASDYNPEGLPERTIKEVRLYEFGPVVFPAYPSATAKVRCLTDHYLDRQREARSGLILPADSITGEETTPDEPAVAPLAPLTGIRTAAARAEVLNLIKGKK